MMFVQEVATRPLSRGAQIAAEELFKQFLKTLPSRYTVEFAEANKQDFLQNVGITIDWALKKARKEKRK